MADDAATVEETASEVKLEGKMAHIFVLMKMLQF